MWLEAIYEPTSLFSLKASDSTNRGAKSLLAPSPYSVKMALLNAMITLGDFNPGLTESEGVKPKGRHKGAKSVTEFVRAFEAVRNLEVRFAISERIVVNNCFIKILKPKRLEPAGKTGSLETLDTTVTFREYVYFSDDLKLAFDMKGAEEASLQKSLLRQFLPRINYFGKRGCFFQFKAFGEIQSNQLPEDYAHELKEGLSTKSLIGRTLTKVDDFDRAATFENANNFSSVAPKRITRIFLIPRTRKKSSKAFTLYSA